MRLILKMIITNENEGFSEVYASEFQIHKKPIFKSKLFYHTLRRYFLLTYGLSIEQEGATTGIYVLTRKPANNGQIVFGITRQSDHTWLPYTVQVFCLWDDAYIN